MVIREKNRVLKQLCKRNRELNIPLKYAVIKRNPQYFAKNIQNGIRSITSHITQGKIQDSSGGGPGGVAPKNVLDHALQTFAKKGGALLENFITLLDKSRG